MKKIRKKEDHYWKSVTCIIFHQGMPVHFYLRQTWIDQRFTNQINKSYVLNRDTIEKIWRPDTFCSNARETNLMMPEDQVHSAAGISPNGSIWYSRGYLILYFPLFSINETLSPVPDSLLILSIFI